VTALYTGDPTHGVSVSVATDAVVHKVESMTVVAPVTGVWGEPVRLTADVSPRATGTVTFTEGATVLGTSVVMGDGRSTLDVSGLTVGSHTITATYSGDTNVKASVGSAAVTVSPVPTAVVLLASPATVGQPLSITARVTPTSAQGSMTLTDNGELLGACTLAQGTCAIVARTLAVGPHTINASYSGDPLHATSAASLTVHVDPLTVRARAKAVARKSKVRVSVSPRCTAQYSFSVERKTGKKWVKRGRTYRTAGSRNRRDVDLPRGTYRVAVAGGCGRLGTTTSTVTLMR
jgi:hypothetical protein